MEENILKSIKDMLGIHEEDQAFDNDILVNINATFSTLYQIGVGSEDHYFLLDGTETWRDVIKEADLINFIKLYTYMKVKIIFDPPTNASILQALTEQMKEIEYRILLEADPSDYFNDSDLRCDHKIITNDELKNMWQGIMGGTFQDPGVLSEQELRDLWDRIIGGNATPSNTLTDQELRDLWYDIIGGYKQEDNALSNEDVIRIWNQIMSQRGGD